MGSRYSRILEAQYERLQDALAHVDGGRWADDGTVPTGTISDREAAEVLAWNYRKQHATAEDWRKQLEQAEMMIIELIRILSDLNWEAVSADTDIQAVRKRLSEYGPHIAGTITRARELVGLSLLDEPVG